MSVKTEVVLGSKHEHQIGCFFIKVIPRLAFESWI